PAFTYRGDTRSPEVIFREGFQPRGNSADLFLHALDNTNPPSIYVSTSRSFGAAADFADNVYVVRPVGGIDVNRALGPRSEPPRLFRRLLSLRGWSHEKVSEVFPRGTGAGGSAGAGAPARARLTMGGDWVHCREDRLHVWDATALGTAGGQGPRQGPRAGARPERERRRARERDAGVAAAARHA